MPCNTVRTVSLDLEAADMDLMADALADLGYENIHRETGAGATQGRVSASKRAVGLRVTVGGGGGQIELVRRSSTTTAEAVAGEIKRAYAGRVLAKASRKLGWTVRQVSGSARYEVSRR